MLFPAELEAVASHIVSGYQEQMVSEVMTKLIRALAKDGKLTVSELELLEQASRMNAESVARILAKYNRRIATETRREVAAALRASDDGDVEILKAAYPGLGIEGSSALFVRISTETAEGLASIIARDNLKMAAGAQRVWIDVTGEAITRWNHGSATLDRIIGDAVDRLLHEGLTVIDYKSGVRSQLDVAVRRHAISQIGQASGRMTMARLEEAGHDLVRTSAHFGARPEHGAWQGRAFSLTGSGGYPDFFAVTGYGTGPGLMGWNCRHTFGPYFPGITELDVLPERHEGMTSEGLYEATQRQRELERAIRKTKRDIHALDQAGVDNTRARLKLGRQQQRLREHVAEKKLPRQPKREKAYGVGSDRPRALSRR